MKRLIILIALVLAGTALLFGQTETAPQKPETDVQYQPIHKGDQHMRFSLGPLFPLFIYGPDGANGDTKMDIGGAGAISYTRYLTNRFALGGGISFAFNTTLAENVYFFLPLTLKASYEFVFGQIQVPVGLSVGGAFQTYDGGNYFGLYFHPETGIYWRQSPEWSFGVEMGVSIIPQNYDNDDLDRTGFIMDSLIGVRYHF